MVTIYDIAEATGYSAPTVSKALNGLGSLSEETRQRIMDKAKELGYDAGFGPGKFANDVATFCVKEMVRRGIR